MTRSLYVLLCLFTLLTVSVFGQEKLSVSATINPVYANTTYTNLYLFPDSNGQVVDAIFLNGNTGASGYAAGLSVYYTYAPGWSVATGVWYRHLTTRIARLAVAGDGTTRIRNRGLRIPLLLNYRSSSKRLSPYYTLGILIDIPFSSRVIATRSGGSTQNLRLSATPGPLFNALLGAGAVYQINRNFALTAQPTVTYKLGRFGGALTDNRSRSYELGLLTQLIYTF